MGAAQPGTCVQWARLHADPHGPPTCTSSPPSSAPPAAAASAAASASCRSSDLNAASSPRRTLYNTTTRCRAPLLLPLLPPAPLPRAAAAAAAARCARSLTTAQMGVTPMPPASSNTRWSGAGAAPSPAAAAAAGAGGSTSSVVKSPAKARRASLSPGRRASCMRPDTAPARFTVMEKVPRAAESAAGWEVRVHVRVMVPPQQQEAAVSATEAEAGGPSAAGRS